MTVRINFRTIDQKIFVVQYRNFYRIFILFSRILLTAVYYMASVRVFVYPIIYMIHDTQTVAMCVAPCALTFIYMTGRLHNL